MIPALLRSLRPAYAPLAILLAAATAVAAGPELPPSLSGLKVLGPYVVLALGAAISVWFNRSRAFIALVSLLAAYAGYSLALGYGAGSFIARAVFAALAVLVPLNVLAALVYPELGVRQHRNYRWLLIGAAEILGVAWIASAGRSILSGTAWQELLDNWLLRSPPTPFAGRIAIAAAFVAALARAWPRSTGREMRRHARPLDVGMAGALVAFFIACEWAESPGVFAAFVSAAGLVLLVSVLQESHRLAFRDELTGLASRRALEERLPGLGPAFTAAMVDVDHFKEFNDRHGHATGDQVLKLVAALLADVAGGGAAYRYGGEEFVVLFPGRTLAEALPHLEQLRERIAHYRMAVRGGDRPQDAQAGTRLRAAAAKGDPPEQPLSVTVSIGAAESGGALATPAAVIKAADEALYRAKRAGRNRVSR